MVIIMVKAELIEEPQETELVKVDNDNVTYFDNSLFIKSFGNL